MLQRCSLMRKTFLEAERTLSKFSIVCPGQGSQYVGMFSNLKEKQFPHLEDNLKDYLKNVIYLGNYGPKTALNQTVNCQPAVVLSSILTYEKFRESLKDNEIDFVAGYSVGEISALYISGCLSFNDVLRVVKGRAEAMQHASDIKQSGMITIQGLTHQESHELCEDLNATMTCGHTINVAIEMYSNCVALGGVVTMLNKVMNRDHVLLKDESGVKITPIPVSGAFHTPYMAPAQDSFRNVLESVNWFPSNVCLYSNVTGKAYAVEDNKSDLLVRQLCETVRWSAILNEISKKLLNKEITKLMEVGPGKQLRTMLGKVNRKALRNTESIDIMHL